MRFGARSIDLSARGITMQASRVTVLGLASDGAVLLPGEQLIVRVDAGEDAPARIIEMSCRIKNIRRLSHDEYLIGAWLGGSAPMDEQALDGLVALASRENQG